jgi:probable DNA metabolism protein
MKTYNYDGSFEGLLSCVFHIFETKTPPLHIHSHELAQSSLLDEHYQIATNTAHAERVIIAVDNYSNDRGGQLLYRLFLSEQPAIEMTIYHLIKIIIRVKDAGILTNFADSTVLQAAQIDRMIGREVHRMHAFVRFQKMQGGLFYATVEPDFNVLPLLGSHFKNRYADQPWVIMDCKRGYGLKYDLEDCSFISTTDFNDQQKTLNQPLMDEEEMKFQNLWGAYFNSVNIKERDNPRLHLRHMPRRYWKYLTEKKPAVATHKNRA